MSYQYYCPECGEYHSLKQGEVEILGVEESAYEYDLYIIICKECKKRVRVVVTSTY